MRNRRSWQFWISVLAFVGVAATAAGLRPCEAAVLAVKPARAAKYNGASGSLSFSVTAALPGTVTVEAEVEPPADWVHLVSGAESQTVTVSSKGTAKGLIRYTVDANTASTPRSATIEVRLEGLEPVQIPLNQGGAPCRVTLDPMSSQQAGGGGEGSFDVIAPQGCGWAASVDPKAVWITIQDGGSGSGSGTVTFSLTSNDTSKTRTGKIWVSTVAAKPYKKKHNAIQPKAPAQGLRIAEKLSVVDPKSEGGASKIAGRVAGRALALPGAPPADSDYNRDETRTFVQERSGEAFNKVNEILCMISQTRYVEMVNQGAYVALVEQKLCEESAGGGSAEAGTSASGAPEYMNWTVLSSRADNASPAVVLVWIHEAARDDGDWHEPEKLINARMTITEASSEENPTGIFQMNFVAYPAEGGAKAGNMPMFKGTLWSERDAVTGKVQLRFAEEEQGGQRGSQAVLEKSADGSGKGTVRQSDNWNGHPETTQFDFAYTADLFHRSGGVVGGETSDVCLDRNTFETSAWRYGLYDEVSGARAELDSGFPFNTQSAGQGANGWVGYHGLWVQNETDLPDGTTIYRRAKDTFTPYVLVSEEGKLKKFTRHATTLGQVVNLPMEGGIGNSWPTIYRVAWTGDALVKTGSAQQGTSGPPAWQEISPAEPVDVENLMSGELNFWSSALGGQVRIQLSDCIRMDGGPGVPGHTACSAPTGETPVAYFTEEVVLPGEAVPSTLACFDNCPKAGVAGIDPANPRYDTWCQRHDYGFSDYLLRDGENPAVMNESAPDQPWGFNSGPLFPPDDATLASLACDWNPAETCGWKAWSVLESFYTWETGPNRWNRYTGVAEQGGAIVSFDPPWRVAYTHQQTDDTAFDHKYDGVVFHLEYAGFGQLQGIPGKCVDVNTGEALANCGENTRWVPELSIPAGASVSRSTTEGAQTLLVKPLEQEQRMSLAADGSCSGIPVQTFTLPSISVWADPATGSEPTVTNPPAVIGGLVQ